MEPVTASRSIRITAALLGVAGALQLAAAGIRWAPCLVPGGAPPTVEGYDPCALAEDHLRDYVWVSTPFEPVPGAVVLAGIASLLMVALWACWAVWMRRHGLVMVAATVTAVAWLVAGATQLLAAFTGGTLGVYDYGPVVLLVVPTIAALAPLVAGLRLAALTAGSPAPAGSRRGALAAGWMLVALAAVLAFPLVDYALLNPAFGSHDSPIWSGAPGALGLVAAAVAFAFGAARNR